MLEMTFPNLSFQDLIERIRINIVDFQKYKFYASLALDKVPRTCCKFKSMKKKAQQF